MISPKKCEDSANSAPLSRGGSLRGNARVPGNVGNVEGVVDGTVMWVRLSETDHPGEHGLYYRVILRNGLEFSSYMFRHV